MQGSNPLSKGFTLIELAIVIAIIAILAAVALPRFSDTTTSAECSLIKNMASQLTSASQIYYTNSSIAPTSFTDFVEPTVTVVAPKTISIATFGSNARTNPCQLAASTITCNQTFKRYDPVTYTYNTGAVTFSAVNGSGTTMNCL